MSPAAPPLRPAARPVERIQSTEINRSGLYGLAGDLIRDESDPFTIQFLEEIQFFARRGQRSQEIDAETGPLVLKTQKSQAAAIPGQQGSSGQNLPPLKLLRAFGRNKNVKEVLNLSGIHGSHIAYVASSVLVFFDFYNNKQSVLQGHTQRIVALHQEENYEHIVTVDSGSGEEPFQPPTLIIWNVHTGLLSRACQIDSGDPNARWQDACDVTFVGGGHSDVAVLHCVKDLTPSTSGDGTPASQNQQMVSIWTLGHKESHLEASETLYFKKTLHHKILASTDKPHHFVTYGQRTVLFYTWLRQERKIIYRQAKGHWKLMSRLGDFTTGIWIQDSVLICTTKGYILEFKAQKALGLEEAPDPNHNIKEFRRFIKIDEDLSITAIVLHKDFIVVGDSLGGVRFLDTKFRILRWIKTIPRDEVVTSIAFSSNPLQPFWKKEMRKTYFTYGYPHNTFHREGISAVYDYTFGGTKYRPPSETTLERNPLHQPKECLDMVVGYEDGAVAYFHIAEGRMDLIVPESLGKYASSAIMAVSPITTHLAMCTPTSDFQLVDYHSNEVIFSGKLFTKEMVVTTIKYHPSGALIVLGNTTGTLYFRRAVTLTPMDAPLAVGKSKIMKVEFSSCGLYLGLFDTANTVTLCNFHSERVTWTIKGKHKSHYHPVVDICFFKDPELGFQRYFSLGEDRRLIEYNIAESRAVSGLEILQITNVEVTAIPTAMVFAEAFSEHGPLIHYATTKNKIRVFDQDEYKIRKTCQAPNYGSPITSMTLIAPESSAGGSTKLILTIQKERLGLIKTPVDGNPFKAMPVFAHPEGIVGLGLSYEGREIFTVGANDCSVFMWMPEMLAMENFEMTGGYGVTPYRRYLDWNLPAGESVVNDIENIFYHSMLTRAPNQEEFVRMNRRIPVTEIPTVMRTCGYFVTEQEVEQILEETEFLLGLKYGEEQNEIRYDDFLVLFANHKDGGVLPSDVVKVFSILAEPSDLDPPKIPRENFVTLITTKGEKLEEVDLPHFLPNFYEAPAKEEAKKYVSKARTSTSSWYVKADSETSHTHSSVVSITNPETSSTEDEQKVSVAFDTQRQSGDPKLSELVASFPHLDSVLVHKQRTQSDVEVKNSELLHPEDAEGEWAAETAKTKAEPPHEMPRDITAAFFIERLLPADAYGTLKLVRDEVADDMYELNKISEDNPVERELETILNRWKGRDEWRYFKDAFRILANQKAPLEQRLQVAVEMDYTYRLKDSEQLRTLKAYEGTMGEDAESAQESLLGEDEFYFPKYEKKISVSKNMNFSAPAPTPPESLAGEFEIETFWNEEENFEEIPDTSFEVSETEEEKNENAEDTQNIDDDDL